MKPTGPEDRSRNLSEDALESDPIEQFSSWLGEAVGAGLPEPNAMVLATTSAQEFSHARTVLLKEHDARGFVVYTDLTSRKGTDLAVNPGACGPFPWYALGR